jgi:hypothetical protein
MSKKLNRKKPGYTKSGEVKIVSLNSKQLAELMEKTQQKKKRAKIQRRIWQLTGQQSVAATEALAE